MPGSFQFTCPDCGQQMMLPADTIDQEGICPGCQQVVAIRPDVLDLKTVATPLVPLPPASPDPGVHSPQLAPAESDQRVNEVSGVYIPRSLLFLVGIGGSVVLLVAILLLLVGGADPPADDPSATTQKAAADYSSPEGLGAMLLSALQSDDKKQFLLAVPTVKEYRGWIKQARTPRCDHAIAAKSRQLLRKGRLPDAENIFQVADVSFPLGKGAKDHQPVFIGQALQEGTGTPSIYMNFVNIFHGPKSCHYNHLT